MFEQYMRNAMILIMDDPDTGSTLMEIPKVLADEEFRALKLSEVQDAGCEGFLAKEAQKAGGEASLRTWFLTSLQTDSVHFERCYAPDHRAAEERVQCAASDG